MKLQEGRAVVYPPRSDPLEFPFEFCWQSLDSSQQFFGSQTDIYERLAKPVLLSSLQGINACLFAYGQTGTGKTHSVMGIKSDPGVLPRFCQDVFEALSEDIAQVNQLH